MEAGLGSLISQYFKCPQYLGYTVLNTVVNRVV